MLHKKHHEEKHHDDKHHEVSVVAPTPVPPVDDHSADLRAAFDEACAIAVEPRLNVKQHDEVVAKIAALRARVAGHHSDA